MIPSAGSDDGLRAGSVAFGAGTKPATGRYKPGAAPGSLVWPGATSHPADIPVPKGQLHCFDKGILGLTSKTRQKSESSNGSGDA